MNNLSGNNPFKPYDPETDGWLPPISPPPQTKQEEPEKPKASSSKSEDKKSAKTTKPKSNSDTQSKKPKPFPANEGPDKFTDPKTGFFIMPGQAPEPEPAPPPKTKGLMYQPKPKKKNILGMDYYGEESNKTKYEKPDKPKIIMPPIFKRDDEKGLIYHPDTGEAVARITPSGKVEVIPFDFSAYEQKYQAKNPVAEQTSPQKFISKTTPIDKFMGISPTSPFDRPLDNPNYTQPAMPPKPESGKPKDYVHNPDGKTGAISKDPFLEGLYGDDYDAMMKKRFIEPDPFLQGLNGEEGNGGYDEDQTWGKNTPQKFVSKTTPIDKFMGVSPSSPFDRPLDNPVYNQPAMPPKPESGKPKDYVYNLDGRKTYDFRDPHASALDYVFSKDFRPFEWKQGIDNGGKLGYDGNQKAGSNKERFNEQAAILDKTGMILPAGYADIDSVFDDYYKALQTQGDYEGWGVFKKPFTKEDNEAVKTIEKLKPFINGLSMRTIKQFPVQQDDLSSEFGQLSPLGAFEYANVPITIAETPAGTKGYIVHNAFYPEKTFEKLMNDDYTRLYVLEGRESMEKLATAAFYGMQADSTFFAMNMQDLVTDAARAYASMDRVGEVLSPVKSGTSKEDDFAVAAEGAGKANPNGIKINVGKQDKHIPGTNNYKQSIAIGANRSTLAENPQQLLDDFAGTGQKIGANKERVDFGKVIGQYYDESTGTFVDTTRGIIHYDSKGGAHIVPSAPR